MKKLLLLLVGCLFFFSCDNKESSVTPAPSTDSKGSIKDVELLDGVLKFSSNNHLKNVISEIRDLKDMGKWYPNPGFTSLLERQNSITKAEYDEIGNTGNLGKLSDVLVFRDSGEDKYLEKIVEDPRLAAVLNSNGYIIISDTAYHIGVDQASAVRIDRDKSILREFLQNKNMEGAKFSKLINEQVRNARIYGDFEKTKDNRRIRGEFKRHVAPFYASLVVKVSYFKKNWIGWSGTEAEYLSFTTSGNYSKEGVAHTFSGSRSGSNVEEVNFFVDENYSTTNLHWGSPCTATMNCITGIGHFNNTFTP